MILYSVNYKGPHTSYEWSIVTIHKTSEGANKAKDLYTKRFENIDIDVEYKIVEINTNLDSDIIYDYDEV